MRIVVIVAVAVIGLLGLAAVAYRQDWLSDSDMSDISDAFDDATAAGAGALDSVREALPVS